MTARTCPEAAEQRAEHLAILGARYVLELCVGPSMSTLRPAYARHGIDVRGNDIDDQWKPDLLGHCLTINWAPFDTIVFAPPLSVGCTGRRQDALSIDEVMPSYQNFWGRFRFLHKRGVMVLPARAWSTSTDRRQYHQLLARVLCSSRFDVESIPLNAGRRGTRKYIDMYLTPRIC